MYSQDNPTVYINGAPAKLVTEFETVVAEVAQLVMRDSNLYFQLAKLGQAGYQLQASDIDEGYVVMLFQRTRTIFLGSETLNQ